jgi:glycosyltransferase involved in cell wall biosynthesis
MFRILHSIRSVNPKGGGPIEGLKQLASVNQRHGHAVEIISLDSPSDPWVRDCPIRCHAVGPSFLGYGYSPRLVPWLRENRRNYDIVIVNGIWQYSALGVWSALRNTTTPYFVFTHGMLDPWFKRTYPLKHLKKWLYWPWGDYRVLRDATAVLFTCEEERRLARQSFWLYRCDEFVVNYGTSAPSGDPTAQRAVFLQRFPEIAGKRCLLFLGRMHVKKGPELVLQALAKIMAELPRDQTGELHLVMAGPVDHDYGRKMVELARRLDLADRITWTGMLAGDLKWGAFHAADAFILPSHQENFGIAVVEALACGVPVLISNQVNIWREITMDGVGLVETDDLEGTVVLLRRWLSTPSEVWEKMKDAARDSFTRRYHIDRAAESLVRAMELFGVMPFAPERNAAIERKADDGWRLGSRTEGKRTEDVGQKTDDR